MWNKIKRFFGIVGPGVVTGAADDDPSAIATFSQSGAQFGYAQLWSVWFMLPMMIAVQEVCARIGIVTGSGIARVVRRHYPRPVLYLVVFLITIANIINLGADLAAMAAATGLIVPLRYSLLVVAFALISFSLQTFVSYSVYSRFLKWLTLSLLAYVVTGFVVSGDWMAVFKSSLVPTLEMDTRYLTLIVAMIGAGISPYMFFWQASQEVEQTIEECEGPVSRCIPRWGRLPRISPERIRNMRIDTLLGMFFSRVAAWFIIITAAGSLHQAGVTDVSSAADAAKALVPLVKSFPYAGVIAETVFAAGIIGLGLLAVPVFAGSIGYALGETLNWRVGLFRPPAGAPEFYGTIIAATLVGMVIALMGLNPIRLLVFAAVINGVVTVPLVFVVILIGSNREIMGEYTNGIWTNIFGWITFVVTAAASVTLFLMQVRSVL